MKKIGSIVMAAAAVSVMIAGGCSTQGTGLPIDEAWVQKEQDVRDGSILDQVGHVFVRGSELNVEKYRREELERARERANGQPLNAYDQLVDQVAQKLAADLPALSSVQNADRKQVLLVGDVVDDARLSDPQLDAALRQLAVKLQENEVMRQNFVFVGLTSEAAERAKKSAGAGEDFVFNDPMSDSAGVAAVKYNPSTIYTLSSHFARQIDTNGYTTQYSMIITVARLSTRETVSCFNKYAKFHYHPYLNRWITDEENEQLKAKRATLASK